MSSSSKINYHAISSPGDDILQRSLARIAGLPDMALIDSCPYPEIDYIPEPTGPMTITDNNIVVTYPSFGGAVFQLTEKEKNTMKKSRQEIEFEKICCDKHAQFDDELEQERLRLQDEQKKAEWAEKAKEWWYMYSGLISAGFNEEQAMQILLTAK